MTNDLDAVRALADTSKLSSYQERDVLRTSIAIRRAGDGLSAALAVDPEELPLESTVFVVLECVVKRHEHEPIDGTDALELKQVLHAGTATLVDRSLVSGMLENQRDRILRAKEEAAGVSRLDMDGSPEDEGEEAEA